MNARRPDGWLRLLRVVDGGYFVWRGLFKALNGPAVWLFPRVVPALPTTPLAPVIRHFILPHAILFGWVLAALELSGGLALAAGWLLRPAALLLFALNLIFLLTLGFKEPHDLALNLLMAILNLMFAATVRRRATWRGGSDA